MAVNSGQLFLPLIFRNSVMIIQARLCSPADMQSRMHMGLAPLHDGCQLIPVVHLLEFHVLHRRSGDDHAIEFPAADFIKGNIKLI